MVSAIAKYLEAQQLQEQQVLRKAVKQEFENYLQEHLGQDAVEWLRLYLQGKSQDEIARKMNKPIKEIYRLREKLATMPCVFLPLKVNQNSWIIGWKFP